MVSPLPGHDFHNTWGTVLGVTELHRRPLASYWMKQYWEEPMRAQMNFGKILQRYTDMFEQVPTSVFAMIALEN